MCVCVVLKAEVGGAPPRLQFCLVMPVRVCDASV